MEQENKVDLRNKNDEVIRSTDLIPNMRPVEKKDVERFVKNFKRKKKLNEELNKEERKNENHTSAKEGE